MITTVDKSFTNEVIPDINVSVENGTAHLSLPDHHNELDYNQEQICELISLLVEVHEYMENNKENHTMGLFNDRETEEDIEEIVVIESTDKSISGSFGEIVGNATSFLYMHEDYSNHSISKNEMSGALHILRDSINSYLNSSDGHEQQENQQQESPRE